MPPGTGLEVTLIEKDIVGGAAHLLDCIPSKAMIATGGAMSMMNEATKMGLAKVEVELDFDALRQRITGHPGATRGLRHRPAHRPRTSELVEGTGPTDR